MAVYAVLLYVMIYHWYPAYYFLVDGGLRGAVTILAIHIALGPGLTLLVFRQGKPGLKFDVTVIVLFQMLALSWGVWMVYTERPALTVFYDGEFICMKQSEVADVDLDLLDSRGKGAHLLAVLPRPNTYSEYRTMLSEALSRNSASIYIYGERFLPMDVVGTVQLLNYTLDVSESFDGSPEQVGNYRKIWSRYLENNPDEAGKNLYFPLTCRFGRALAVFDPEAAEIIDFLPVHTRRAVSRIQLGFTRDEIEGYRENLKDRN